MSIGRESKTGGRRESGIALILCLLVLSILIILVSQFAFSVKVDEKISRNSKDDVKGLFASRAAVAYVRAFLREDRKKGGNFDSKHEDWAREDKVGTVQIGDTSVTVKIEDCEAALDVNLLADEAYKAVTLEILTNVVKHLGWENYEEIANRIGDYIDTDSDGDYEQGAKNGRLTSADELLAIRDIPPEVWNGVAAQGDQPPKRGLLEIDAPLLTTWGSGKLNLNTIPEEIAWSMFPSGASGAQGGGAPGGGGGANAAWDDQKRQDAWDAINKFRTDQDAGTTGTTTSGTGSTASTTGSTTGQATATTAGTNPATTPDAEGKLPGQDFENVQKLGEVVPDARPLVAGSVSSGKITGGSTGGGTPSSGSAGQQPTPKKLKDILTVTAQDFHLSITTDRAGEYTMKYEAILRRGDTTFDLLFWREVPQ